LRIESDVDKECTGESDIGEELDERMKAVSVWMK